MSRSQTQSSSYPQYQDVTPKHNGQITLTKEELDLFRACANPKNMLNKPRKIVRDDDEKKREFNPNEMKKRSPHMKNETQSESTYHPTVKKSSSLGFASSSNFSSSNPFSSSSSSSSMSSSASFGAIDSEKKAQNTAAPNGSITIETIEDEDEKKIEAKEEKKVRTKEEKKEDKKEDRDEKKGGGSTDQEEKGNKDKANDDDDELGSLAGDDEDNKSSHNNKPKNKADNKHPDNNKEDDDDDDNRNRENDDTYSMDAYSEQTDDTGRTHHSINSTHSNHHQHHDHHSKHRDDNRSGSSRSSSASSSSSSAKKKHHHHHRYHDDDDDDDHHNKEDEDEDEGYHKKPTEKKSDAKSKDIQKIVADQLQHALGPILQQLSQFQQQQQQQQNNNINNIDKNNNNQQPYQHSLEQEREKYREEVEREFHLKMQERDLQLKQEKLDEELRKAEEFKLQFEEEKKKELERIQNMASLQQQQLQQEQKKTIKQELKNNEGKSRPAPAAPTSTSTESRINVAKLIRDKQNELIELKKREWKGDGQDRDEYARQRGVEDIDSRLKDIQKDLAKTGHKLPDNLRAGLPLDQIDELIQLERKSFLIEREYAKDATKYHNDTTMALSVISDVVQMFFETIQPWGYNLEGFSKDVDEMLNEPATKHLFEQMYDNNGAGYVGNPKKSLFLRVIKIFSKNIGKQMQTKRMADIRKVALRKQQTKALQDRSAMHNNNNNDNKMDMKYAANNQPPAPPPSIPAFEWNPPEDVKKKEAEEKKKRLKEETEKKRKEEEERKEAEEKKQAYELKMQQMNQEFEQKQFQLKRMEEKLQLETKRLELETKRIQLETESNKLKNKEQEQQHKKPTINIALEQQKIMQRLAEQQTQQYLAAYQTEINNTPSDHFLGTPKESLKPKLVSTSQTNNISSEVNNRHNTPFRDNNTPFRDNNTPSRDNPTIVIPHEDNKKIQVHDTVEIINSSSSSDDDEPPLAEPTDTIGPFSNPIMTPIIETMSNAQIKMKDNRMKNDQIDKEIAEETKEHDDKLKQQYQRLYEPS